MSDNEVMHLGVQAMVLAMKLAGPSLIISLVLGFAISLLQAVTQVQEATLTFVPKVIVIALVLLIAGHWMLSESVAFMQQIMRDVPTMLRS